MHDPKLDSPSFHRNVEPILALLKRLLAEPDLHWLEIGSGSGQHVVRFGQEFPHFIFQPTEIIPENLNSISAWVNESGLKNVKQPHLFDVTDNETPFSDDQQFDIISAFNVIHIAPWAVTEGLFRLASQYGNHQCRVFLYGPFKIDGENTSESNAKFELWLKEKDVDFGIRDIGDVNRIANHYGFGDAIRHPMPANNFMMEFVRQHSA